MLSKIPDGIVRVTLGHLVCLLPGEGADALVWLVMELAVHSLAITIHHFEGVRAVTRISDLWFKIGMKIISWNDFTYSFRVPIHKSISNRRAAIRKEERNLERRNFNRRIFGIKSLWRSMCPLTSQKSLTFYGSKIFLKARDIRLSVIRVCLSVCLAPDVLSSASKRWNPRTCPGP